MKNDNDVRLIDANAFKAILEKEYESNPMICSGIAHAVYVLDSAPTVETADNVFARLDEDDEPTVVKMGKDNYWAYDKRKRLGLSGHGKTPTEALNNLETILSKK